MNHRNSKRDDNALTDIMLGADVARENLVSVLDKWPNMPKPICELLCEAIDDIEAISMELHKFISPGLQSVH